MTQNIEGNKTLSLLWFG